MSKKVILWPVYTHNPILPSVDEAAEFCGLEVSAREKVRWLERMTGQKFAISNGSLDNLGKKGISNRLFYRAVKPFWRELRSRGFKLGGALDHFKGVRADDSAKMWLHLLTCFEQGVSNAGDELDIRSLYQLIHERDVFNQHFLAFRQRIPRGKRRVTPEMVAEGIPLILKPMLLTECEKETLLRLVEVSSNRTDAILLNNIEFNLMNYDFYLSLFATVDLTLVRHHNREENYPNGLLGAVLEHKEKCFFGKFMAYLKGFTGKSYYELANSIPINERDKKAGGDIAESQKDTMKAWRRGKVKPSWDKLDAFFANLAPRYDTRPVMIIAWFCLAIDRQVSNRVGKGFKQEEVCGLFEQVFEYDIYARYYRARRAAC